MANTTNFGWETPDDTDLVKDGAAAMRTLGQAIDTSLVDLKGGTTDQVLAKNSNTDMDFKWVTSDDANAIQNAIVDAKGDLIAASAADTPARLAVGNNGETVVADSSQTTGLRYNPPVASLANPVINGGMDIWQRGTSFVPVSSGVYTADRWQSYRGFGSASGSTVSRQTISDSTNLPNIQYAARIQRDSGNTSNAEIFLAQSIETANAIPYAGKTVTLTYYARAGANFSPTSSVIELNVKTGTGTDQNGLMTTYTGEVLLVNENVSITTTWTRYSKTFTIGATVTEFALLFSMNPTGTAGANDWFEVTGVQIDVGTWTASTAPAFRRSGNTLAGELAAASRYYVRFTAEDLNGTIIPYSFNDSSTQVLGYVTFPTRMRVKPTSIDFANVRWENGVGGATFNVSGVTLWRASDCAAGFYGAITGGPAGGTVGRCSASAAGGYIGYSAEL